MARLRLASARLHLLIGLLIVVSYVSSGVLAKGRGGKGGGGGGRRRGGGQNDDDDDDSDNDGEEWEGNPAGWIILGVGLFLLFIGIFCCTANALRSRLECTHADYGVTSEGITVVSNKAYERLSKQENLTKVGTLPPSGRFKGRYTEMDERKNTSLTLAFHKNGKITGTVVDDVTSLTVEGHFQDGKYYWGERSQWARYGGIKDKTQYKAWLLFKKAFHVEVEATSLGGDGSNIYGRYFASNGVNGYLHLHHEPSIIKKLFMKKEKRLEVV